MEKLTRKDLVNKLHTEVVQAAVDKDNAKRDGHTRMITRLWPTEASATTPNGTVGRCRRNVYYSQIGIESPDMDFASLSRFAVGNMLEDWYGQQVKDAGNYHSNSVKISFPAPSNPDLTISGEVDIIYQMDDEVVGGEIKSSYGYTFVNTVFHKKTIPGMPKVEHLMQVMMYLYYYKHVDTSLGITRFIITYIDRGSMDIIHHVVELADDGVPIVNGIKMEGINNYSNGIFDVPSINTQKTHDKLIKYQININDVFERYNGIYQHLDAGLLIEKDYDPLYDEATIQSKAAAGEISKSKHKDYQDGKIAYLADMNCEWCAYRLQCMQDEGLV